VAETQGQLDFLRQKARRERELGLDVEVLDRRALIASRLISGPQWSAPSFAANEGKLNPLLANAADPALDHGKGRMLLEGQTVGQVAADR